MTEVAFAKTFLTTLDSKTTKYQPDHVFDVASIGTHTPVGLVMFNKLSTWLRLT